jgi:hypothetical protein
MPRTIRTLAAALMALVIAAPVAFAKPMPEPIAGTTPSQAQDLRSPDARDAAHAKTPADIAAALAQERYYSSYGDREPLDVTAAQYAQQGRPEPATAPAAEPSDGIDSLPFVLGLIGALIVGTAAGGCLHLLYVRRHATSLAA